MATCSDFLPEDLLTCSICLEVYTEPVSIPCGHNFCKVCLTKHLSDKEHWQCPLCNSKFSKGIKLFINTNFKEVVEKFKKQNAEPDSKLLVKPGQVPCDCCIGKKIRASKTCLVCLVSYCEAHLEPHLRVVGLKRHKLTYPLPKLEEKICKRHNRILEFFCRTDQTRVCALCTEHSDHDTVHLDEEFVDKSSHMGKKKKIAQESKQKGGNEIRAAAQRKPKQKGRAKTNSVKSNQMISPDNCSHQSELPHVCTCFTQGIFGGIHLFEFPVKGRAVFYLGVMRKSMLLRRNFTSNVNDGSWIIRVENKGNLDTILMHLDYENGQLLFFDPGSGDLLCSFFGCSFRERLILYFDPGQPFNWAQKVKNYVVQKNLDKPFILLMLIFILCVYYFLF